MASLTLAHSAFYATLATCARFSAAQSHMCQCSARHNHSLTTLCTLPLHSMFCPSTSPHAGVASRPTAALTVLAAQRVSSKSSSSGKKKRSSRSAGGASQSRSGRGFGGKPQADWESQLLSPYRVYYKQGYKPPRFQGTLKVTTFEGEWLHIALLG